MPRPAALDASLFSVDKPVPIPPSFVKHDANRGPRFWHAAVTATKGLFNQPTRGSLDDGAALGPCVPLAEDRRRRIRRSTSTPALKACASTGNLRRDFAGTLSPPVPPPFTKRSFEQSPRKLKSKAFAASSAPRRPAISSPSLPKPLDSLDSTNPKLSYPLSPIPSPVGSTFSLNTPSLQATSQLPILRTQSDDVACNSSDNCEDSRPVRRRTKSAPGTKLGKRSFFSPALSAAQESDTRSIESSLIVIDIASPSIVSPDSTGSLPSPPLETPTMSSSDYFTRTASPPVHVASPRGFMSVKRKPVPRHLYLDPPEHDASAPCTPVLTPIPNSSPTLNISSNAARNECSGTLRTPLLPSSELILKACNPYRLNNRGLNLLPIGQTGSAVSARKQHRRSVSEHCQRRLLSPDAGVGLPSPWYTTNASGSMTPLMTPAEEQAPFSFANDLPAAPRAGPRSSPQTPIHVMEEISAFSDNTSVRSSVCRSGTLSPLTDDEIDAIRSFLRKHATGHRARQRRKASKPRKTHSRDTSCSYEMHAQILESYATDEDEYFSLESSEDDADAESHVPMSSSETQSMFTAASLIGTQESEHGDEEDDDGAPDFDVETPVIRDEINTPIETVNRGTFGYYGTPIVRRPRSSRESNGAYAYIRTENEIETRPGLPEEWRKSGIVEHTSQVSSTFKEEDAESDDQAGNANFDCLEDVSKELPVGGPPRSSSLYYRSPSHYAQQTVDDDSLSYLRSSRQPLMPRTLNSDSETQSDRPISSSTSSFLTSMSTERSAFASGIGLAIIPPEHFAHFDKFENYEYVPPRSPSEYDLEGSPTTLACVSPSPRSLVRLDTGRNNPFDGLRTDLSKFQNEMTVAGDATPQKKLDGASPMLKPALQINPIRTVGSTIVQLPSPTDTIETYPPQTFVAVKGRLVQKAVTPDTTQRGMASASADEATPGNVKSFMNLTPNEPAPKRSRVKLRQLFSRANLKTAAGRKVSA